MSEYTSQSAGEPDRVLVPPLGSPERAEALSIGEALLTDDGQVTDTPQAKTIAIGRLARRMQTPTPELVLAAMGLSVGSDLAAHLGSPQHVVVPHNARYPSMGVDVLHVDELGPAFPREAPAGAVRMDSPEAELLVRMVAVSELMGAWSYGSNNNVRVLALQEAAAEEFEITDALEWHLDPKTASAVRMELSYNRDALRHFLRTQHQMTQEVLAARGITEVIAYRALSWPEGAEQPLWVSGDNVGTVVQARERPLSSWSADRQVVADWLEQRTGHGVIVASRQRAAEVLSLPTTGMGFLGQMEWVALPGDYRVTLDGIVSHLAPPEPGTRTAAAGISLGAPALAFAAPPAAPTQPDPDTRQWQPLSITDQLDPAVPLDAQILGILAGTQPAPPWWPQDRTGYVLAQRDLDFLGINPVQIKWMVTGEAPMGMTPALYGQFSAHMLTALGHDGIDPADVDIRIKGSGAGFYAGIHKTLPGPQALAHDLQALQRLHTWFGEDSRPLARPFDAMWRLGLESEPSDFDLDINSTAIVGAAREHWRANHSHRYPGDFMGGHGYLDKATVLGTLPALADWARTWEATLGRPISLGVFESSGPFDATQLGRTLSSHFRDTDWIIHSPDRPEAWRTPRSRIAPPPADPSQPSPRTRPLAAAARARSTTVRKPRPPQNGTATSNTQQPPHLRRPGPEPGRGRSL
ncbi:hypothetical protein [Streptomyces californicus]|uniref:hypothetical protein n=1 Tax=Streptomyces californicus TaxID=67351 RepID=UPI00367BDA36